MSNAVYIHYNSFGILYFEKITVCITLPCRRGSRPDGACYKSNKICT